MAEHIRTEHVKYVVEVKRVSLVTTREPKSLIVKETPTDIESAESYNRGKKLMTTEYETRDVQSSANTEQQVFRQEVADLDLVAVINAVNKVNGQSASA